MKFKVCLADNPWKFNSRNNSHTKFGTGMHKYSGMTEAELIMLYTKYVVPIMEEDSAILCWTVNSKLNEFFHLADALKKYGYRFCTTLFTWIKTSRSGDVRKLPGHYTMTGSESVQLLVRGSIPVAKHGIAQVFECDEEFVFYENVLKPHSKKPDFVKNKVVELFGDCARIELFARESCKKDDRFVYVGDEVQETSGMDIIKALSLVLYDEY